MVKKSLKHYEITNPIGKGQESSAEKVLLEASLDLYKIVVVRTVSGGPKSAQPTTEGTRAKGVVMKQRLDELFAHYMEQRDLHRKRLSVEELCADCPELTEELREYIRQYEMLDSMLAPSSPYREQITETKEESLPQFEGFRKIEQIGKGGGGNVYKLEDLKLRRIVAATAEARCPIWHRSRSIRSAKSTTAPISAPWACCSMSFFEG